MNSLKSIFDLKKSAIAKVAVAVGITLSLSSCLKNKDVDYVAPPSAGLFIFHASPGTPIFNVAIGETIVNNGYDLIDLEYKKAITPYVGVTPGSRKITLLKRNTRDTIRTGTFNLVNDKYYSLFVVDAAPSPNFLFVEDVIAAPAANKARVRFVNLNPEAGALSLIANSGADTLLFDNIAYKTATPFTDLSGTKSYKFEIKSGATSKAIVQNIEIKSNGTYTIWANGLENTTNDSLKTAIKVNQHVDYYR
jgi:hypothetical protein